MIPKFPEFKTIEITDKKEVDEITSIFPPYSDFNFTSLWSWDIKGEMRFSCLNNNLVVRLTDYLTGDPVYSCLGKENLSETIGLLLDYSKREGLEHKLKLIPEDVINNLHILKNEYVIEEDIDHHDYIYDIASLVTMEGSSLKSVRNLLASFLRRYPVYKVKILDLKDAEHQDAIIKLYKTWQDNTANFVPHEFQALQKCLHSASSLDIFAVGIFIEDELIAFNVNQVDNAEYVSCFFAKANIKYYGIYALLMNETAKILVKNYKAKYLNYEQDLGLFNLRKSKQSFNPAFFLKKYYIKNVEN